MDLTDRLKQAAIEHLEQAPMILIESYARRHEKTLRPLYDQGIIDDASIEGALEVAALNQARRYYQSMFNDKIPYPIHADHVSCPECLAYAIQKGEFTDDELKKIPFDHDENTSSYPIIYGRKDLIPHLRKIILNPSEVPFY